MTSKKNYIYMNIYNLIIGFFLIYVLLEVCLIL